MANPKISNPQTTNGNAILAAVILISLLTFVSSNAWACSCVFPTVEEDFQGSDVVFTGEALRIDQIEDERRIKWDEEEFLETVEVELKLRETWKGTHEARKTVLTALHEPSCGYPFVVGNSYVVFAYERKIEMGADKEEVEVLYTHLCSANHERDYDRATQALQEELEELKSEMQQESEEESDASSREPKE